jgi:hypothetical protein
MAFDRDRDWVSKTAPLGTQRRAVDVHAVRRAAVEAGRLTGDESWDFFLSALQAKRESLVNQRNTARELLENSDNFTPDSLINEKLAVRLFGTQIDLLDWVMDLPNTLLEQGERVKQVAENADEKPN